MSDIVGTLADQIMALINAKPQSPTRDEIVALLAASITEIRHPMLCVTPATHEGIYWALSTDPYFGSVTYTADVTSGRLTT